MPILAIVVSGLHRVSSVQDPSNGVDSGWGWAGGGSYKDPVCWARSNAAASKKTLLPRRYTALYTQHRQHTCDSPISDLRGIPKIPSTPSQPLPLQRSRVRIFGLRFLATRDFGAPDVPCPLHHQVHNPFVKLTNTTSNLLAAGLNTKIGSERHSRVWRSL
jgi:hypothetical protein